MRTALSLSVLAPMLALVGCAPMGPQGERGPSAGTAFVGGAPQARQCFSVSQVSNYRRGETGQVFLRVGRKDVYELSASGGCPDLDFAQQIALVPDGGSVGSRICTEDWARVVVPGSTSPASVCRVRISRQLTEAEVAALPGRYRP